MPCSECALLGLVLLAQAPSRQIAVPAQRTTPNSTATADPSTRLPSALFPTGAGTALGSRITDLLRDPKAAAAHWGVAVTAMDGTPIYGLDEGKLFRPASTAKLFTTAAAMALLGPDARVETRLTYTGTVAEDGTLDGYLTLRGAGDTNLAMASATSPGDPLAVLDAFAAAVAARGIRKVSHVQIGGWLWDPYPQGWALDDRMSGFGAPVTGLVLNDNTVTLTITAAARIGDAAAVAVEPEVRGVRPLGTVTTVAAGTPAGVSLHEGPESEGPPVITGTVAIGEPVHTTVAVLNPAIFAENAFLERLAAYGVQAEFQAPQWAFPGDTRPFREIVREPVTLPEVPMLSHGASENTARESASAAERPCDDGCTPLTSHTSGPLSADVTSTLKESKNLHAEAMLRRLGEAFGRDDTFAQGVRVMRQFWTNAGLDPHSFVLYDGSGLSAQDLVTPRAEVQLLAYAATKPWFGLWKAALPIGGVDGTLAGRFTQPPLKGHILAKTGTLGESRALAGYLQCASGREVIFSILDDNHESGSAADRVTMDKIVEAIAASD